MTSDTQTTLLPSERLPEEARQVLIDRASDAPRLRDELDRLERLSRAFGFTSLGFSLGATVARLSLPSLGVALSGFQDGLLKGISIFATLTAFAWIALQWRGLQAMDEPKRRSIVLKPPTPPTAAAKAARGPGMTMEGLEQLLDARTDQVLGIYKGLRRLRSIAHAGLTVGILTASLFGPAALALWDTVSNPGQRPLLVVAGTLIIGWNAGCLATLHRLRRLSHETLA